jgi:hypothetical protein
MLRHQHGRNFMRGPGYGPNILRTSWIPFFESTNSIISCTCSSTLELREKFKEKNEPNIAKKKSKLSQLLKLGCIWCRNAPWKNWTKKQKKYSLPRAATGPRQRSYADVVDGLNLGPSAKGTAWAAVSTSLRCRRPFFTEGPIVGK